MMTEREPFLRRAEECSKLTIPSLIVEDSHTGSSELPTPYQSIGARGVNNLASKMLLTTFPPTSPYFQLETSGLSLSREEQSSLDYILSRIEKAVMTEIEVNALRIPVFEALKHLFVGGNVLIFTDPRTLKMRIFGLNRYVVSRDPMGNVLKIVIKESVSPDVVPDWQLKACFPNEGNLKEFRENHSSKSLDLYTGIKREGDHIVSWQELNNIEIPKTRKVYREELSPWQALRYVRIDGQSYGRGFVEEYFGDLRSAETLTRALVQGAAASARLLMMVSPNSAVDLDEFEKAKNGDAILANVGDITPLQIQKQNDFSVAAQQLAVIEQNLKELFLLGTSIQRQGERVTAEEIRYMSQELTIPSGGSRLLLAQELQLPLTKLIIHSMTSRGMIPPLPSGLIQPKIVTGLENLGRSMDLESMMAFLQYAQQGFGQEAQSRLNASEGLIRLGTATGVDTKGLVKSDEELQQEAQQQQQQQMQQQMMEMASKAAPTVAGKAMEQAA